MLLLKASAHSFKHFYFAAFKIVFLSLSMHLLPRMNVVLDFIWTLPFKLRGTRNGSSGGRVVKLLACGARGPGFDSPPRHLNFRDWLSPASKSRYGWKIAKATLILNKTKPNQNQEHGTSEHYQKILSTVGFEPATPRTASRLQVHRSHHSATNRLIWEGIKCQWNLLSINKLERCMCISHQQCVNFTLITYEYC